MITCPECLENMELWEEHKEVDGMYRFTSFANCCNPVCELYNLKLIIKSRDGNYWLIPPTTNRGVTSTSDTSIQGGG